MGSSSTKALTPVQNAKSVVIDNSHTSELIGFHWQTFGQSAFGFLLFVTVAAIMIMWCFCTHHRVMSKRVRRARRDVEEQLGHSMRPALQPQLPQVVYLPRPEPNIGRFDIQRHFDEIVEPQYGTLTRQASRPSIVAPQTRQAQVVTHPPPTDAAVIPTVHPRPSIE